MKLHGSVSDWLRMRGEIDDRIGEELTEAAEYVERLEAERDARRSRKAVEDDERGAAAGDGAPLRAVRSDVRAVGEVAEHRREQALLQCSDGATPPSRGAIRVVRASARGAAAMTAPEPKEPTARPTEPQGRICWETSHGIDRDPYAKEWNGRSGKREPREPK